MKTKEEGCSFAWIKKKKKKRAHFYKKLFGCSVMKRKKKEMGFLFSLLKRQGGKTM